MPQNDTPDLQQFSQELLIVFIPNDTVDLTQFEQQYINIIFLSDTVDLTQFEQLYFKDIIVNDTPDLYLFSQEYEIQTITPEQIEFYGHLRVGMNKPQFELWGHFKIALHNVARYWGHLFLAPPFFDFFGHLKIWQEIIEFYGHLKIIPRTDKFAAVEQIPLGSDNILARFIQAVYLDTVKLGSDEILAILYELLKLILPYDTVKLGSDEILAILYELLSPITPIDTVLLGSDEILVILNKVVYNYQLTDNMSLGSDEILVILTPVYHVYEYYSTWTYPIRLTNNNTIDDYPVSKPAVMLDNYCYVVNYTQSEDISIQDQIKLIKSYDYKNWIPAKTYQYGKDTSRYIQLNHFKHFMYFNFDQNKMVGVEYFGVPKRTSDWYTQEIILEVKNFIDGKTHPSQTWEEKLYKKQRYGIIDMPLLSDIMELGHDELMVLFIPTIIIDPDR